MKIPNKFNRMGIKIESDPAYVEYLESTGTQYIDTGYIFDSTKHSKVEIKFAIPSGVAGNNSEFGFSNVGTNCLYANITHLRVGNNESAQTFWTIFNIGDNVFTFQDGKYSVNGGAEVDTTYLPIANQTFDLFTINWRGNHTTYLAASGTKIYYCRFYQGNTLVKNLVPVLDGNNVACMYDTVNKKYYYNGGTGTFNHGNLLYSRKLTYIESTGTQYINTGVKPDFANGDSIEVKFYKGQGGGGISFMGSRQMPGPVNGLYVLGTGIVCCDDSTFTPITFTNTGTFTLKIDNDYIKINDTQNTMPLRVSCTYDMFLFSLNNGGSALSYATDMKLYEWKYYKNGELKQWLIPVLDIYNVPCLFDKVNLELYHNAGSGAFVYGELPYTRRLSYIESTGTQYINTDVKPDFDNGDEIYISFYGAEFSGASPAIFGSRQSDLRNGVYGLGGNVTVLDADGYNSYGFDLIGNRWVKMDDSKVTSNGRNYEYTLTRKPTCTYNIYLFALNNGGNTYGIYNGMKLYQWRYYKNSELQQRLIPVLDNNSIPCLYDEVSGTFFYNAGTGSFNYE